MKISIITACYNSADTIERAIESVLNQNCRNFEHIIVDGGSRDGTVDILKRYAHLKWISEPDNGQVDAMHKGFGMSSGEIIGNLNGDDYYIPGAFEAILPLFEGGEDFVMGKVKVFSEHNQTIWINDPEIELEKMLKHWATNAFCVNPVGYFYRREVQEAIPFNKENSDKHDLEFLLEAAARYKIKKIDIILGVFSHVMEAKTFREQMVPSYWRNENFAFVNSLLEQMDVEYQKQYSLEREIGYQLRRLWTIRDSLKLGKGERMLRDGELFLIPEDENDSLPSRCGFVDFDRLASTEDWVIPVLTMGKVASKAICHALKYLPKEVLPAQVYHIHQINLLGIKTSLPSRLPYSTEVAVGSALMELFQNQGNLLKWKFITGVRDPIAAALSSAFENSIPLDQLEQIVIKFARHITKHYFRINYQDTLGINLFDFKFDRSKGYMIIKNNNVEVLLYRFEDLPRIFSQAMEEYLGIPDIKLPHVNVASQKKYADEYEKAKKELIIDKVLLDEIYSSQMVKHCYTKDEIQSFYRNWQTKTKDLKIKRWFGMIYDIGMHSGQDTEFYLKKGFKVVAVDANPTLLEEARKKFAPQIADGQLILLNLGIVEEPTQDKVTFYINERHTEWSSFVKELAMRDGGPYRCVEVNCTSLRDIIDEHGKPYYVKIDIEGFDHIALKSLLDSQTLSKYVSVENGNMAMLKMLYSAGYDAFKYVQQNNIHMLSLPNPPKEGLYVEHAFPFGSSGPFGEETHGDWKSYDDVRADIAKVWDPNGGAKNAEHDDAIHGWFDLHARLSDSI